MPSDSENRRDIVSEYYGKDLQSSQDLKTNACCCSQGPSKQIKEAIAKLHPEVLEKFYGCGSPIPEDIAGLTVLDLGCGSGRDSYVVAQLVGEQGRSIGIDMTQEQLSVAKKHQEFHREAFGYARANTDFKLGDIEDLKAIGIEDNSIDLVISNCVINLSANKDSVFSEISRVLKPGGKLYFADVFVDRELSPQIQDDKVLVGECLAGAMTWQELESILEKLEMSSPKAVTKSEIEIKDSDIKAKLGSAQFSSITVESLQQ